MKNPMKIIDAFFSKPVMIERTALRVILAAMNAAAAVPETQAVYGRGRSGNVVTVKSEIAVIPVLNVLSYRADFFSYLFDETSYQDIRQNFRQAIGDNAVSAIVLDMASPGGSTEGLFDLVDEIYQARGIKPIYAIINEMAFSAAYVLASAADKIFIPRTAGVGSLGTLMVHIDQSEADKIAGIKYTEIFSGDRKVDGNPHAPLSEEALAVYKKHVDQLNDLLVETVARNRGLKPADVVGQQAGMYFGKEAVAAGLADTVLSWDAAWKKILGQKTIQGGAMKTKLQALLAESPTNAVQALAELGYVQKPEQGAIVLTAPSISAIVAALGITTEQLAGDLAKVDLNALRTAAVQAGKVEAKKETLAYVKSILDMCALAAKPEMAAALIAGETKIEDARKKVMDAKAQHMNGSQIRSSVGAVGTGGENPLLANAKQRAGVKAA